MERSELGARALFGQTSGGSHAVLEHPEWWSVVRRSHRARLSYPGGPGYRHLIVEYRTTGAAQTQELARRLERQIAAGELGIDEEKVQRLYENIVRMWETSENRHDANFIRNAIEAYAKQDALKLNSYEKAWLMERFGLTS